MPAARYFFLMHSEAFAPLALFYPNLTEWASCHRHVKSGGYTLLRRNELRLSPVVERRHKCRRFFYVLFVLAVLGTSHNLHIHALA